MVRVKDL